MNQEFKGKTAFITGSSRGIGASIAMRLAEAGANVVITGKTTEPHPKLKGTIFTVAQEIEAKGGKALALQLDVREEASIQAAVDKTVETFGGIDILVNNASAIQLTNTADTELKRFDLMFGVNVRGTFACARACIPHLKKSSSGHILMLSPPINLDPKWFKPHLAYTMSKYGMSMCVLGLAEELKRDKIAVNALWPRTTIATAAIEFNFPKELLDASRHPAIMSDAAYYLLRTPQGGPTGQFNIDDEVLKREGITDLEKYAVDPSKKLFPDLFL